MLRDLSEVRIGDPVVRAARHRSLPGIDRSISATANEFLHLLYANDAKLYVPVSSLPGQPLQRAARNRAPA
jgi:transcription-repair coupling factor (superfamily II helicase)